MAGVDYDQFIELLPILRRAFAKFATGERRQIGEKAKQGLALLENTPMPTGKESLNHERGTAFLPHIQKFLFGNHE